MVQTNGVEVDGRSLGAVRILAVAIRLVGAPGVAPKEGRRRPGAAGVLPFFFSR